MSAASARSGPFAEAADAQLDYRSELAVSYRSCHAVTRAQARNFYYGMKLTPEPQRSAMYAIYAWMRQADDLADEEGDEQGKLHRIELFRERTHAVLQGELSLADCRRAGPMWPAVCDTLHRYAIPQAYLDDMIAGQLLDQRKTTYATFDELYDYCYKVASVVGLICISIWGYTGGEATRKMAEHRGIAFQLTNILRDVAEDAQRGRCYLPQEDLEQAGYSMDNVAKGEANAAFDRLMQKQLERAQSYYDASRGLEKHLEPTCRATSWAMMRIYRGLLDAIARNPRGVLKHRVSLSKPRKACIALRATLKLL